MNKKIIEDIFEKEERAYLEYLKSEQFENNTNTLESGIGGIIGEFTAKARSDAFAFTEKVLLKLFESEDFKRELFEEMIEQGKKEARRTQENPFEV